MSRFSHNAVEAGEMAESRWFALSGARWRALVLATVLAVSFFLVLMARLPTAYSDDGPGVDDTTFDSPIIIWKYPSGDKSLLHNTKSTPGDLLRNGDMDQEGFYWRYPNHYIAGGWFEWFSTRLEIPEFTYGDRDYFIHTPPGSQRIQKWATTYAGGLMQSPTVTPCTYYRFQAYGHSRPGNEPPPPVPVASHMRVGIEPYGWMSGRTIPKYDPGLEPEEFPSTVFWSPEATHDFVWAPYEVTAEALSDTVTVILFSKPEVDPERGVWWNDTLWDTASLVEVQPPSGTILDSGRLPEPDGLITNVSIEALPHQATVEWDTSVDASSQILYRVYVPISPTEPLSYTVFMPAMYGDLNPRNLTQHSPVDQTPVRHHQVVLTDLPDDYIIDFVALSRRLQGAACVTSASEITRAESASEVLSTNPPTLSEGK